MDDWTITQVKDCTTSLSAGVATDVELVYTSGAAGVAVTPSDSFTTWDAFFSNSDSACAISSCTISDSGSCGGSFSGSSDITFDTSTWALTASKTNTGGYSHSVCIECTNGQDTQSLDGWTIS